MDVGSTSVKEEQFVRLDVESCYDSFLEVVWRQGGGLGVPRILEPGDPLTGRGCERRVGLCIVERIQEAQRGQFLEYAIERGPWPTSYNQARVTFQSLENGTIITWVSNFTPKFGFSWLPWLISFSFRRMLASLVDL